MRHNRSVARAEAANDGQQVDGNGGVISFWGPDGSVNPLNPNADALSGDPQAEDDLVEGMPAPKLPKYSEVAQDPEGKKYLIVTMPLDENNASQTGCSAAEDLGPPPSFSEIAAATAASALIDEPPPCYDEISIGMPHAEESNGGTPEEASPNIHDGETSESTESSRV